LLKVPLALSYSVLSFIGVMTTDAALVRDEQATPARSAKRMQRLTKSARMAAMID
jgi:hypothetical protein